MSTRHVVLKVALVASVVAETAEFIFNVSIRHAVLKVTLVVLTSSSV